jgi:hypothetical protein
MDYTFTTFDNLAMNWCNDGRGAKDIYQSGENIDFSRGEDRRCVWVWTIATRFAQAWCLSNAGAAERTVRPS